MPSNNSLHDLAKYFNSIKDPRVERQKLHALPDMLLIVFCGAICGSETWQDFEDFGHSKMEFLKKYAELKNGIPSKNTFNRVISALDPNAFKECFINWVRDFKCELGNVIAIDGKTLRRSHDKASERSTIHMVSAFASEARLVLAQEKVAEKSNEITAIPRLLDSLNLEGAVVTIDAMGCQKNIAHKIIAAGGNYVLAVKGNQGQLHMQIKKHFESLSGMEHNKYINCYVIAGKSRGRVESRKCLATENLCWLDVKDEWAGIKSCIVLESSRTIGNKTTTELRYYISSLENNAEALNKIIRAHWGVENSLHWILDVVFGEDYSRIRMGNAAENMSMIKHVALNKLQAAKSGFRKGMSIKSLRKNAGWDDGVLDAILRTEI
jgi:predicted transposase YbfD/YdcC